MKKIIMLVAGICLASNAVSATDAATENSILVPKSPEKALEYIVPKSPEKALEYIEQSNGVLTDSSSTVSLQRATLETLGKLAIQHQSFMESCIDVIIPYLDSTNDIIRDTANYVLRWMLAVGSEHNKKIGIALSKYK